MAELGLGVELAPANGRRRPPERQEAQSYAERAGCNVER